MRFRLTIRRKLLGGFMLVVVLLVATAAVAVTGLSGLNDKVRTVGESDLPAVQTIGRIQLKATDYRLKDFRLVTVTGAEDREMTRGLLAGNVKAIDEGFTGYDAVVADEKDRAMYEAAKKAWADYYARTKVIVDLVAANRTDDADRLLATSLAQFQSMIKQMDAWSAYNSRLAAADVDSAAATYSRNRTLLLALALVATLTALGTGIVLARGIGRRLEVLTTLARRVSVGDLTQMVTKTKDDEIGDMADAMGEMAAYLQRSAGAALRLADGDLTVDVEPASEQDEFGRAFQSMTESLREMIGEVARAADGMGSSSQQMAATSEEAGRAVGEIANAVSDVAAGAERQVRMVEQARASTTETGEAAEQALSVAQEGVAAAQQAAGAMAELNHTTGEITETIRSLAAKSEEIGGIVGAITGIAEQTNLLALNAAIEAARAGEQGRGFAVVAEEVRKLAEEAQRAAASIGELVAQIQAETGAAVAVVEAGARKTEESTQTVEAARGAFEQIGVAVEDMRHRIEQIVDATNEVAAVAEQSSASTEEVSASTEETSASTQEIAASASELATTAEELQQLVARFRVATHEATGTSSGGGTAVAEAVDVELEAQLTAALAAHAQWKTRLKSAISTGTCESTPAEVGRDDACAFGRWLREGASAEIRSSTHYARCVEAHAAFHKTAAATLQHALAGDRAAAEADLRLDGAFTRASARITSELMTWQRGG